jgi:hypothetical protein
MQKSSLFKGRISWLRHKKVNNRFSFVVRDDVNDDYLVYWIFDIQDAGFYCSALVWVMWLLMFL